MITILIQGNLLVWQVDSLFRAGQNMTIKAEVEDFFQPLSNGYEGSVKVTEVNGIRFSYFQRPTIQLIVPRALQPGDVVEAPVQIKSIIGLNNEVGFDRERYALSQHRVARATIAKGASWLTITSYSLRSRLFTHLQQQFSEGPERALTLALAFGYRGDIDQTWWQALRNSGLAHLVAISGLHIGIAFSVGFWFGALLLRVSYRMALLPWILGSAAAFGYSWLAGFSITTERALIMCLLNVMLSLWQVRISIIGRLLLTLAVLLIWDPFAPLSVSFWLSFIAVSAVLTYLARQTVTASWGWQVIKMQGWLTICMLPATVGFFDGMTPVSAFYNLVFVPWFSVLVVPLILIGLVLASIAPNVSFGLWTGVEWTLKPAIYAIELADEWWWPIGGIWLFRASLLCLYALFWTLLSHQGRWGCAILCVAITMSETHWEKLHRWRLDVLDVGHGLAIMMEQKRRVVFYDSGPAWEGGNVAESIILPLLRQRNVDGVDGIILSHLDSDHAGGWRTIAAEWQPEWIRSSQHSAPFSLCVEGQKWDWNLLEFEVLWPLQSVTRAYNLHSCVIRIYDPVSQLRVLLTGDIEALVEWILIRQPERLRSDIVIVPHHGSKTSSIAPFTQAVEARYAIASFALGNRWNLPASQVVQRYQESGSLWLDTAHQGQITLRVEGEHWWIESRRQSDAWYRHLLRKRVE